MKKTFKFFAAALAIVAAASCAKETVATPEGRSIEKTPVTLSATFNVDDETKATLAANNFVHWTDTDKIGVQVFGKWGWDHMDGPFSIDPSSNDADATFALFNGELSYNAENGYYAVLPATNWSTSSMKFNGFAAQTAVKGSFDPNKHLAISERASGSTYTNYKFHNVCALLKVTVGLDDVYSIKVEGKHYDKYSDKYALGDAFAFTESYLSVSGDYKPAYWYSGAGAITLSNNGAALENGATYYIVVPHVTVKEFKVSLCDKAGNVLTEKAKASDFKIQRNKVYDLGTFDNIIQPESLVVNKTSLEFAAEGGTDNSIQVNANVTWSVTTDADWLTASKVNPYVVVKAAENTKTEPRTATITITGEKLSHTITVTQAAAVVAKKTYVVNRKGIDPSELKDGGVYRIHKTSASYRWYNDPSTNKLMATDSFTEEGTLFVFTKKGDNVGTITALETGRALSSDLTFTADEGQWFTFVYASEYNGEKRVNVKIYGTDTCLYTSSTSVKTGISKTAFVLYEMVEQ